MKNGFWQGRRVLVTGHTGFKGSWLALWLHHLGAQVVGYALPPPFTRGLFETAGLAERVTSIEGDVRDREQLLSVVRRHQPEVVFHLAAQSLVRPSYQDPVGTYSTNVMGTMHLLEALRLTDSARAIVNVTSDKCYDNKEWVWGYRESDPVGGHDPYSSSKGCAELLTRSYRRSFFPGEAYQEHRVALASARAGNVIGGGDWSEDRLIPDIMRALEQDKPVFIRNPQQTRPWQHVLESLSGYLSLARALVEQGPAVAEAWNFGPRYDDTYSVRDVVERTLALWGEGHVDYARTRSGIHEASLLKLDCSKAKARLDWTPRWQFEHALGETVAWYRALQQGADMLAASLAQIDHYGAPHG